MFASAFAGPISGDLRSVEVPAFHPNESEGFDHAGHVLAGSPLEPPTSDGQNDSSRC